MWMTGGGGTGTGAAGLSEHELAVHALLADLVLAGGGSGGILDVGSGRGNTLAEIAVRAPARSLAAVDLDDEALAVVASRLPGTRAVRHDIAGSLPFPDGSFDAVVSHNVLECLLEPSALLLDVARVLRPGGRAVLGHTDFDTLVVAIEDRDLARRILRTYAELPVLYANMAAADPWMGRRLPGIVRSSPLRLESVHAHTTTVSTLADATRTRLGEVTEAVRRSAAAGHGYVEVGEIDEWQDQLRSADLDGSFLFSETAFVVVGVAS